VRVSKLADSRVGVGLANGPGRTICVAEVFASSPLEGHIWPGDIIRGVAGTNLPPRSDAASLANIFRIASDLDLSVETPRALSDARTVFLICQAGGASEIGIMVDKDPSSSFARVSSLAPGSLAATELDRGSLRPGDLIVAVGFNGGLHQVSNVKDCAARLQAATGAIELRVVRPGGWPTDDPRRCAVFSPQTVHVPQRGSTTPPPAYEEHCGALSTLTAMLENSRLACDALRVEMGDDHRL